MAVTKLLEAMKALNEKTIEDNQFLYRDFSVTYYISLDKKFLFYTIQLIFSPLEGRVRVGARVRMDGPMNEKIASSNTTTSGDLIEDILKSEAAVCRNAHEAVCPVISLDDKDEEVENLLKMTKSLINIFKEKRSSIEVLSKLSFDDLLTQLTKQNSMVIVNSIADFLGLGIPKICQVNNNLIYKTACEPFSFDKIDWLLRSCKNLNTLFCKIFTLF